MRREHGILHAEKRVFRLLLTERRCVKSLLSYLHDPSTTYVCVCVVGQIQLYRAQLRNEQSWTRKCILIPLRFI